MFKNFGLVDNKWWIFGTIAIGTFISVLDQTGISLALPRLATHFNATIPDVQWVTLGYMLASGSLLMPMGRLSDLIGRKKVYIGGFGVFIVSAFFAGMSAGLLGVIAFKILQGVGAAMVQANGLAIITSVFPTTERGKVIGLFMTVVGAGAIAGPVAGGFVVDLFGWRAILFLGVPLGLIAVIIATITLPPHMKIEIDENRSVQQFDWVGACLSSVCLALFLVVITNAYRVGWDSPWIFSSLVLVVLLLFTFVWWELRVTNPMLSPQLFRRKVFTLGVSASFLNHTVSMSVFFLMPFYLQGILGMTSGEAGLIIVPTAICFGLAGPIAGRLSDRFGWRKFSMVGLVLCWISLVLLSTVDESTSIRFIVLTLSLQGLGLGAFSSPNTSAVLSTVDRSRYGIATAFLNMSRNTANVIGIALAATIVTSTMAYLGYEPSLDVVSSSAAADGVKEAFARGLQIAYLSLSGFVALSLFLTIVTVEKPSKTKLNIE